MGICVVLVGYSEKKKTGSGKAGAESGHASYDEFVAAASEFEFDPGWRLMKGSLGR
jgi:hypothetical protein